MSSSAKIITNVGEETTSYKTIKKKYKPKINKKDIQMVEVNSFSTIPLYSQGAPNVSVATDLGYYQNKQTAYAGTFDGLYVGLNPVSTTGTVNAGSSTTAPAGGYQLVGEAMMLCYDDLTNFITKANAVNLTPTPSVTRQYYIKSVQHTLAMTNCTNFACELNMYYIEPREDIYWPGSTSVGISTLGGSTGLQLWHNGVVGEGANAGATQPYVTPFDSDLFTCFYKVTGVQKITLMPGATHSHKTNYDVEKIMSYYRYYGTSISVESIQYLRNWTKGILIQGIGQTCIDVTGVAAGAMEQITVAPCHIVCQATTKITGAVTGYSKSYSVTPLIGGGRGYSNPTLANAKVIGYNTVALVAGTQA